MVVAVAAVLQNSMVGGEFLSSSYKCDSCIDELFRNTFLRDTQKRGESICHTPSPPYVYFRLMNELLFLFKAITIRKATGSHYIRSKRPQIDRS